jgi:predicted nucleotidyltransferase
MDETVKLELEMLKNTIVDTLPVEQVILFGSYAYGTPHKDSDLDLYVVMKDSVEMREIDACCLIMRAISRKKTMPVDIICGKKARFANRCAGPTMERKIARDGMVLFG